MTSSPYRSVVTGVLTAWFVLATVASALHLFRMRSLLSVDAPLPLGLFVVTPVVAFALWYRFSSGFRAYVLSLNPRVLTILQSWRIGGFVFLVLNTYGVLPSSFAIPAGWGDITVGATAFLLAANWAAPRHRTAFLVWQAFGIVDLVMAITLGILSSEGPIGVLAHGVTTAPMTLLPLSLIPTFIVPLLTIVHFVCILQARRWSADAQAGAVGSAHALAR